MKLILISGFLGSGKTTAITNACQELMNRGIKVAIITNDQGNQQVDSLFVQSLQIPTEQVPNGCFCCNYDQLDQHIEDLALRHKPMYIFAESVGSCTDLVATIAKPITVYRPGIEVVIAVFTDASLLLALLQERASFINEDIRYIYQKQLDDADIIVINKADTVTKQELDVINTMLQQGHPEKIRIAQNSMSAAGVSNWIAEIENFNSPSNRISITIDYDRYASGEGALAWLDKKIHIHAPAKNAPALAIKLINAMFQRLVNQELVIGHLKAFIESEEWSQKLSFTLTSQNIITGLYEPEATNCTLLVNARVQMDPQMLKDLVDEEIEKLRKATAAFIEDGAEAYFQPGYPRPTHRFA